MSTNYTDVASVIDLESGVRLHVAVLCSQKPQQALITQAASANTHSHIGMFALKKQFEQQTGDDKDAN